MRKIFLLFSFAVLITLIGITATFGPANSNGNGAPTGYTGSPFDNKTCSQSTCHGGTATEIFDVITSDVPITGYQPGETYNITATISDPAKVKFGFEMAPQDPNGLLLGTMALSDATHTKFTSSSHKYITHTSAGTSFPNHTATWSFAWTAPAAGTGDVTFYGAFNFTNNNGNDNGDIIHKSTLTIPEAFGTGVENVRGITELNVYPNPVTDHLNIHYYLNHQEPVTITMYDLTGKQVCVFADEVQTAGTYHQSFPIDQDLATGVYLVDLKAGDQSYSSKIVKN